VLSADGASDPDTLAVSAASTALLCSDMPWAGPVAAARAALLPGGELVVGPTVEQQEAASLNVVVAVTEGGRITMLEADGDQASAACWGAVGVCVCVLAMLAAVHSGMARCAAMHSRTCGGLVGSTTYWQSAALTACPHCCSHLPAGA